MFILLWEMKKEGGPNLPKSIWCVHFEGFYKILSKLKN